MTFYDKGTYQLHDAITQMDNVVASGARIIDIGRVKAAPGPDISPTEEIRRLTSLVPVVRERHPTVVISVDTWRAEVAEAAIVAGADMINDAWGGYDPTVSAGVPRDSVMIDPGHDFKKTTAHSLEVTRRLGELISGPWPVLVAVSNKDFIGRPSTCP